mmetsp:Transcript_154467/g.375038  ORF Transcript_154467/g.375038 Transcript_154467/m.375038 type:complete len:441 (+) Transcript_154467:159-1481(+)
MRHSSCAVASDVGSSRRCPGCIKGGGPAGGGGGAPGAPHGTPPASMEGGAPGTASGGAAPGAKGGAAGGAPGAAQAPTAWSLKVPNLAPAGSACPNHGGGAQLPKPDGGWGGGGAAGGGATGGAKGGGCGHGAVDGSPAIGATVPGGVEASGPTPLTYGGGCHGAASADSVPPTLGAGADGGAGTPGAVPNGGTGPVPPSGGDQPGGEGADSEPSAPTVRTCATYTRPADGPGLKPPTRSSTRAPCSASGAERTKRSIAVDPASRSSTTYAVACRTAGHWIETAKPCSSAARSSGAAGGGTTRPVADRQPGDMTYAGSAGAKPSGRYGGGGGPIMPGGMPSGPTQECQVGGGGGMGCSGACPGGGYAMLKSGIAAKSGGGGRGCSVAAPKPSAAPRPEPTTGAAAAGAGGWGAAVGTQGSEGSDASDLVPHSVKYDTRAS